MSDLKTLTEQYQSDNETLADLHTLRSNALATLAELETSTSIDIDDAGELAAKASLVIQNCDFKIRALQKRVNTLRSQIVDLINDAEIDFREAEKNVTISRHGLIEKVRDSKSFQRSMMQLKALYYAVDTKSFETILNELVPQSCDWQESRRLAEELDMIIPSAEPPQELSDARRAIDFDENDYPRGRLGYRHAS